MIFKTKDDGVLFFENVLTSTKTLINSGLWKEISLRGLDNWIQYFESDSEKILCGMLLDALIFRSKAQTQALLSNVIEKSVPQAIQDDHPDIALSFCDMITSKYPGSSLDDIRIVPVIRDIDPPTKSGPLVARLYKKEVQVNEKFMDWPWKLADRERTPKLVVFIDDFIGTGDQFIEFLDRFYKDNPPNKDISYIYAPLAACSQGLDRLRGERPTMKLCHAEMVPDGYGFFSGLSSRYEGISSAFINETRATYDRFLEKVGLGKLKQKYGYGDLELTYTYAHGTPNATLPILWAANENYQPLFSR